MYIMYYSYLINPFNIYYYHLLVFNIYQNKTNNVKTYEEGF